VEFHGAYSNVAADEFCLRNATKGETNRLDFFPAACLELPP